MSSEPKEEKPIHEKAGAFCYSLPWCNIFLVVSCITAHTLVYMGNMATVKTFEAMGRSTGGWADVGLSTSGALVSEIEAAMTTTSGVLTDALQIAVNLESEMDLLFGSTGNSTEKVIANYQKARSVSHDLVVEANAVTHAGKNTSLLAQDAASVNEVKARALQKIPTLEEMRKEVTEEVNGAVEGLKAGLPKFLHAIKPALLQVGKWLQSMGAKIQGFIEQFSQTIDKVQKIFDQVMSQVGGGSADGVREHLLYETWNIFDLTHTGGVTPNDLQQVTNLYGVTALNGNKGDEMLRKYDENKDGVLGKEEYSKFVDDPDLPEVMSYVIRVFAKRLTSIAGTLKGARKRDEVAQSLGDYLTLMAAKNLTKVGWICDSLVNNSKPIELTIDVLKVLKEMEDAPDKRVDLPVGLIVTTKMLEQNSVQVQKVLAGMADPELWSGQGWDMVEQPGVVQTVSEWVANASEQIANKEHTKLFANIFMQEDSRIHAESTHEEIMGNLAQVAYDVTQKRVEVHKRKRLEMKVQKHGEIFYAAATRHVYSHLVGRTSMLSSAGSGDEDVDAALKSGVPAAPETLVFAQFLVNNATACSQRFQQYAFDYSKTSSNQIDSFANGIQAFIKKVQNFLNMMMEYSTERGIEELENKIEKFVMHAVDDIEKVVDNIIAETLKQNTTTSLLQVDETTAAPALEGVFSTIQNVLTAFKEILPTVVDDLKFAKKEVSAVSSTLKSIFEMLKDKGSPIFDQVASIYKMIWTAYYAVFLTITLLLLVYALWAGGIINPPSGQEMVIIRGERGCWAGCKRYFNNCLQCLRDFQDMHLCMWSCIIISEIVILVMFLVSIVFCILAGVKAFVSAGCAQVYLLGDDATCTSILSGLRDFMETFWSEQDSHIDNACDEATLTACKVVADKMMQSAMYTVIGSFAAAIFSLQMIFDFAHRHEQAYFMNKLKPRTVYED
jgi:hypothetical protein